MRVASAGPPGGRSRADEDEIAGSPGGSRRIAGLGRPLSPGRVQPQRPPESLGPFGVVDLERSGVGGLGQHPPAGGGAAALGACPSIVRASAWPLGFRWAFAFRLRPSPQPRTIPPQLTPARLRAAPNLQKIADSTGLQVGGF